MAEGALDAFTIPIGMKKSRPGVLITVLCREGDREKFLHLMFAHTTTLGIRETVCQRAALTRKTDTVDTVYGPVRRKTSTGYGVRRAKYEHEDLAEIARNHRITISQVLEELE